MFEWKILKYSEINEISKDWCLNFKTTNRKYVEEQMMPESSVNVNKWK